MAFKKVSLYLLRKSAFRRIVGRLFASSRRIGKLYLRIVISARVNNLAAYGSFISVTEAARKETIRLLTPIEVLYSMESAIRLMIAGP